MLQKTYKYRLYPTKQQEVIINTQLKLCGQLYNELLNVKKETYEQSQKSLTKFDLNKCMFFFNDNNPRFKLIHSQVKQNICDRVDKSFRNMFARIKRGEKKVGYPRFKKAEKYKSICYPQSGYVLTNKSKIKVSKIGEIKVKLHRPIQGNIKTLTITRTSTNKYYGSFSCDCIPLNNVKIQKKKSVGIDVGLSSFLTTNEGLQIESPTYYRKSESELSKQQKQHSRKKKNSNNYKKSKLKISILHEKVKNQRFDFTHKLSHFFVNNYNIIGIEDLDVKGMVKNKQLSKSINDSGWSMFYNQLQYKAEYADSVVTQINRFYPSSKKCHKCGYLNDMPLHKRIYKCGCGNVMDRDLNAAININDESLRLTQSRQELPNSVGDIPLGISMNQEAYEFIHR